MFHRITEKMPDMIYSGLLTGFILDFLIPHEQLINSTEIVRKIFIFGGICTAVYLSYNSKD